MTRTEQRLLEAARAALVYFRKREKGEPFGMYDDIFVARHLAEAIEAVDVEARMQEAEHVAR